MRILSLRLAKFRLFEDLAISFAPGLNLVRGPNESGKSTIVHAIVACLFEKPQAKNAGVRSAWRWGAAEGPSVEIDFEQEGKRYRLAKDFGQGKALLEDLEGDLRLDTAKAVESRVFELLGFSDAEHYLRTACVTHDQMVSLGEDRGGAGKLAAMLREVVVGTRETGSMERAVKDLTAEVDELKRGLERPARNPGTIAALKGEKERLEARQADVVGKAGEVETYREHLEEVERLLQEKKPRAEDQAALLEKNRGLVELEDRLQDARKRFARADRVAGARSALDGVEREITASYPGFEELDRGVEVELRQGIEMISSKAAERAELVRELAKREGAPKAPGSSRSGWISAGIGVAAVGAGAYLGTIHPALYMVIALGVVFLAVGVYMLRRARGAVEGDTLVFLEEQIAGTDRVIDELEEKQQRILGPLGFSQAEPFLKTFNSYLEKASEKDRLKAGLEALRDGLSDERLEEERSRAALDTAACEAELRELEPFRLAPERMEQVTREHASLAAEVQELKKESDSLRFHLGRASADPEEAIRLEENLAVLGERLERANGRLRVYSLALEAMTRARESMLSSAVPVLAESVGRTFSGLTGGRYESVEVSESDLAMSVYSEEKGDMIPAGELLSTLSKGTVSQLYLSARLKLVDLLSGGRKPPLLFDDSFSYFDDVRLGRLWEILVEVSGEQQVLVLTCSDRYDDLVYPGVNVIEMKRG